MDLYQMVDIISDLIISVISYYLYDDSKKSLKKDSNDNIEKFANHNLKDYKENFEKFVDENSDIKTKKFYEKQRDLNNQNFGILEFQENEEEFNNHFKNMLVNDLKIKDELYSLANSYFFISEPIRKYFLNTLFDACL